MKKIVSAIIPLFFALAASAQEGTEKQVLKTNDQILPRLCVDFNYKYGVIPTNIYSDLKLTGYGDYDKSVSYIKKPTFSNGKSQGADLTVGYFLGKKQMFGVGGGISYLAQSGVLGIDSMHVEYDRVGNYGHYRALITSTNSGVADGNANPRAVNEALSITNISIPLLFKFKHQFNKTVGVSADLGGVINMYYENHYATNAYFDYEAVYKNSGGTYVYETSYPYGANDWLITRSYFLSHNNSESAAQYFSGKTQNYNVALNARPSSTSGNVSYSIPSFGGLAQANFTYKLSYRVTFMIGGYYLYQVFQQPKANDWKITDQVGQYNSMVKGVSTTNAVSYGMNIGVRYFIGGFEDMDGDAVADNVDECIDKPGLEKFHGCPDTDNDGIPDNIDACRYDPGPACTNGCPDRDGDCIADKDDDCPDDAGILPFHGCPDRDMDGVPDKTDRCPDDSGSVELFGCPVSKAEIIAKQILQKDTTLLFRPQSSEGYLPPHIVLSTSIINFDFGMSKMSKESDKKLAEIIEVLNKNEKVVLYIGGYTDNVGSTTNNLLLSYARARTVRDYLITKGIQQKRILLSGSGKENPIHPNTTPEGRARNRRIEMKVLLPLDQ